MKILNILLFYPVLGGGDPSILGWTNTSLYFLIVIFCAFNIQSAKQKHESIGFWLVLLVFCFLLGVNKQLDLQTDVLILFGSLIKQAGLSAHLLTIKLLWATSVFILLICFLWFAKTRLASSIKRHRLAWLGLILLCLFVFARIFTFNNLMPARMQWFAEILSAVFELIVLMITLIGVLSNNQPVKKTAS